MAAPFRDGVAHEDKRQAIERLLRIGDATYTRLAADGHMHVLEWLEARVPRHDAHWHPIARGAVAGGHLSILNWAERQVGKVFLEEALPYEAAAAAGRIDCIKRLAQRDYRDLSGTLTLTAALADGHTECASWLWQSGRFPLDYAAACETAASRGHIHVLEWLYALYRGDPSAHEWDPVPLVALAPRPDVAAWLLACAREP